jgi:uncharacterized repeat protein (TIGR04076 family)
MTDDSFTLYDLHVEVSEIRGRNTCGLAVGDSFDLCGGRLTAHGFCLYALQSTLPLLPAKQRPTHPSDWMTTDLLIHCPDPACGTILRIDRAGETTFRHSEVSGQT